MTEVRLEILPSFVGLFGSRGAGRLTLKKETGEGATVGDLLRKLATEYKAFGEIVFLPGTYELSGYVNIVLNERLLQFPEGLSTTLNEGDAILILPVIEGG